MTGTTVLRRYQELSPSALDALLNTFVESILGNAVEHARSSVKYFAYLLSEAIMEANFDLRDMLHVCFSMATRQRCRAVMCGGARTSPWRSAGPIVLTLVFRRTDVVGPH